MAALSKDTFLGRLFAQRESKPAGLQESRRAREFADTVYKRTKGPTAEAKRLYAELLANERRLRS